MTEKEVFLCHDGRSYSTTIRTTHWDNIVKMFGDEAVLRNDRDLNRMTCQRFYDEFYLWCEKEVRGYNAEFACFKVLGISDFIADEICCPSWGAEEGEDSFIDKIVSEVELLLNEKSVGHFRLSSYRRWTNRARRQIWFMKKGMPTDSRYYRYLQVLHSVTGSFFVCVFQLLESFRLHEPDGTMKQGSCK